jgi:pyrroline-5-carboxylate reductase
MNIADLKIGCIGTGNMGSAILSCLSKIIDKENLYCYDSDSVKQETCKTDIGAIAAESSKTLTEICDIIIMAVKPDVVQLVAEEIRDSINTKLVISVAAGISTDFIGRTLGKTANIIRVMPNTPALIGQGMIVIAESKNSKKDSVVIAEEIFMHLGKVVVLPEKYMDAATAVSGCGPAYAYTLIQAMADGGVKMGLPRDKAILLAAQTIAGAANMVINTEDDPISLRGKVTSPGGATIDAVHVLEKAGFSGILMEAIEAAKIKSEKLGL